MKNTSRYAEYKLAAAGIETCPHCNRPIGTVSFKKWINHDETTKGWEGDMCPHCTLKYTIGRPASRSVTSRSIRNGETYEISGW